MFVCLSVCVSVCLSVCSPGAWLKEAYARDRATGNMILHVLNVILFCLYFIFVLMYETDFVLHNALLNWATLFRRAEYDVSFFLILCLIILHHTILYYSICRSHYAILCYTISYFPHSIAWCCICDKHEAALLSCFFLCFFWLFYNMGEARNELQNTAEKRPPILCHA